MARRPRKPKQLANPLFEIEDNALEIFEKYLEDDQIVPKERDSAEKIRRAAPRTRKSQLHKLDLHGCTVREAKDLLDGMIRRLRASGDQDVRLRIITGKGRHSEGGGVLVEEMYAHVTQTYHALIRHIDEAPSRMVLNGLPIRGHFDVTLRF